jgi:cellulose synthase/poly-beta-1,6-N-acetylglucosamine synthase-like glycosyltransferase
MSDAWPRVSVVTPSFEQAEFLEATLRSVFGQGYPNLEYIVVDGGSTDGSPDLIRRYEPWLAYWVTEPDRGQSDALNKGFRRATGDIFAWLSSDDLYLPAAIFRAVQALRANPGAGIVCGGYRQIDRAGRLVADVPAVTTLSLADLLRVHLPQPSMFFRREVWERAGPLDPALHYSMDWDFTLRAATSGVCIEAILGPPIAAIRVWEGAKTSARFEAGLAEDLQILDRLQTREGLRAVTGEAIDLARAHACLWSAYERYRRGHTKIARRTLRRALRLCPRVVVRWEFLGLYLRTLLGRRLSAALQALRSAGPASER